MSTMGNLFSGSGAWELAAKICGIDVVFEAEIEPFPVAVEAKRFPEAIQLGDVSKINGADIPPVDILTNSSPCQGLSIAGKREGLGDKRSGLFMEAVRITKEMREHDRATGRTDEFGRPLSSRFWCWENVPGVLSCSGGEDFRSVLEEVARIVEPNAVIPRHEKWSYSGVVDLDGGQIAWRVIDSQFYGVAQRRRRLFLVADLGGRRAADILFERKSVSWNFAEIAETWKDTARSLDDRIDEASAIIRRGTENVMPKPEIEDNYLWDKVGALCARDFCWPRQQQVNQGKLVPVPLHGDVAPPLDASYYKGTGERNGIEREVVAVDGSAMHEDWCMATGQSNSEKIKGMCPTLNAGNEQPIYSNGYAVRRLTPTECARLQGFPDDWTSDVPHSNSAEYKLWGNGIALCSILPMMKAMADILEEES